MTIRYDITGIPGEYIRELGIKLVFEGQADSISWRRSAYWSSYPDGFISGATGSAVLYSPVLNRFGQEPQKDWLEDYKSFYYEGPDDESYGAGLTRVVKAAKENIYEYSLLAGGEKLITVLSNGTAGCRIAREDSKFTLYINGMLDYPDLGWGNYQRNIVLGHYSGEVEVQW
jgi:hypothetical protein